MELKVKLEALNTVLAMVESSLEDGDDRPEDYLYLKDLAKQANSKFCVVRVNETRDWLDLEEGQVVHAIYLVDLNEVTHCCEITPSFWTYHLYNTCKIHDEDIENYSDEDQGRYIHCKALDALPAIDSHPVSAIDENDICESYEKLVENFIENYRANHCF